MTRETVRLVAWEAAREEEERVNRLCWEVFGTAIVSRQVKALIRYLVAEGVLPGPERRGSAQDPPATPPTEGAG